MFCIYQLLKVAAFILKKIFYGSNDCYTVSILSKRFIVYAFVLMKHSSKANLLLEY